MTFGSWQETSSVSAEDQVESVFPAALPLHFTAHRSPVWPFGGQAVPAQEGPCFELAVAASTPFGASPPPSLNQLPHALIDRLGRHVLPQPAGRGALPCPVVRKVPPGNRLDGAVRKQGGIELR